MMAALGAPGVAPEGRFFPDTYSFSPGSTDLALLQKAREAMEKQLAEAWAARAPDTPLKSPDEALILASIVEKETGKPEERAFKTYLKCFEKGVLIRTTGDIIALSPPLIVSKAQIDELVGVLGDALREIGRD